jgi:hypothetical protein
MALTTEKTSSCILCTSSKFHQMSSETYYVQTREIYTLAALKQFKTQASYHMETVAGVSSATTVSESE